MVPSSGPEPRICIGIDVGGCRKGFHAAALRQGAYAAQLASRDVQELRHGCREVIQARLIAIDAPSRWSAMAAPAPVSAR